MQENNNIDRINELVSSFFEKGLSEEERTELKKLLETPDNKRYFREVYTVELVARNMKPDNYLESAYDRVMGTIKACATSRSTATPRISAPAWGWRWWSSRSRRSITAIRG